MATLDWNDVIKVAQASDPTTIVEFYVPNLRADDEPRNDVRLSIDGTKRGYTQAGVEVDYQITCTDVDRDDFATLQGWEENRIVIRDPLGRVIFCLLNKVQAREAPRVDDKVDRVTLQILELEDTTAV